MGKTVAEMDDMSSEELTEWIAYDQIDPIGREREDLNTAVVASTIANVYRGDRAPFTLQDFVIQYEEPTPEEQFNQMLAIYGNGQALQGEA